MKVFRSSIPEIIVVQPDVFTDDRGHLLETYHGRRYASVGIDTDFVQDNLSFSQYGVLRGLHFQHPNDQAKLIQVLAGEIFDVAVDVRLGSPTFGQWVAVTLSATNQTQLFIPEGFAHGFCVISSEALVSYKCSHFYSPDTARGICWHDPALGIPWPVRQPRLSAGDAQSPLLSDISRDCLPCYR
jgi:dTDP-4-dehydrorhamnose 3,5-epimerase